MYIKVRIIVTGSMLKFIDMLKREQRLKTADIPHLARKGKKLVSDGFELRVWWDNKITPAFSISVSTSLDKRAVVRNKVKRKFKVAILELQKNEFKFRSGKYLIIVRDLKVLDTPTAELAKQIKKTLSY